MLVYLDTEFTSLAEPQLLSIGMVSLSGEEFYAELSLDTEIGKARLAASSVFAVETVLTQWGLVPMSSRSHTEIGKAAGEWLLQLATESGENLEIAHDHYVDFTLLELAIRDAALWKDVARAVRPLNLGLLRQANDAAVATTHERDTGRMLARHHALFDARALRTAHQGSKSAPY
jgi:hypothetical protein